MDKTVSDKKMEKKVRPAKRIARICVILLTVMLGVVMILGAALFIMYRSGKSSLYAKADSSAPAMASSEEELLIARERAKLETVSWQENWLAAGDKIYEYNEDTINLLFIAVDVAGGLDGDTDYRDWGAGQADAIFVLSLNPADKTMKIVAVPRNSMVNLNIYDENGNAAEQMRNQICLQYGYAGGGKNALEEMKRAVSELLYHLPIHGVTAIGYDAIIQINDTVGGVDVEILEDIIYDPEMRTGNLVHLTGEQAFLYLQYRDVTQAGSPTARLMRQKQYLVSFVTAAKEKIKNNPLIVSELYQSLAEYMNTDITLDEAVYMAMEILDYQLDMDAVYLLQGEDRIVPYINEEGEEDFYDDYELYDDSIRDTMIQVFYSEVEFP